MKSLIEGLLKQYFSEFGIPVNFFRFESDSLAIEEAFIGGDIRDLQIFVGVNRCLVNSNIREVYTLDGRSMSLVGLGEYVISLNLVGVNRDTLEGLETLILSSTNRYFNFEGYLENKVLVDEISYEVNSQTIPIVYKTCIMLRMQFPVLRSEDLNQIDINNLKIRIKGLNNRR